MTIDELRAVPQFTARMAEIFHDPVFAQALVTLKEEGEAEDVEVGADALASVRLLAKQKGRASVFTDLALLSLPLPSEAGERFPTFGTGLSEEEAREAVQS